jgi:hypothetical protein
VIPDGLSIKIPLAYPIGRHDQNFASFLDTWIELKRKDGTIDALFKHWVLGQDPSAHRPRWSIGRDVLQWID